MGCGVCCRSCVCMCTSSSESLVLDVVTPAHMFLNVEFEVASLSGQVRQVAVVLP